MMGSGGGRVIIVHTFYSNDRSSNLAEASRFFVKFVLEMSKNKQILWDIHNVWYLSTKHC